ncbi:MAG: oxidoreductase, partial [Actinomycetota bacterium]|nr:oxidoreductase [Actinomycetota bacterium]
MTRWTADDVPDLTGRRALVTGANSGLGLVVARELARHGAVVVMAVRDPQRGAAAAKSVRAAAPRAQVVLAQLDLADLASVRACAAEQLTAGPLDLLVNNAGVMATPRRVTVDGFELQLATNHLGHFALTGLLLPALLAAPAPRVTAVSSLAHQIGRIAFDDLMGQPRYSKWAAYAQSKLANLLFVSELQQRADEAGTALTATAAHPGLAATGLFTRGRRSSRLSPAALLGLGSRLISQSAEQGALPLLYAATVPDLPPGA